LSRNNKDVKGCKEMYDSMLKSGDLLELFPEMTGDWETDKSFCKDHYKSIKELEEFLESTDLIDIDNILDNTDDLYNFDDNFYLDNDFDL